MRERLEYGPVICDSLVLRLRFFGSLGESRAVQIWPAIDLRGGQCVRLRQGDYDRETVFSSDPVAIAKEFEAAGARHLHLVDLDGAREGSPVNLPIVQDIVAAVDMACELGGGIRDEQSIEELLGFGVQRLVIGTSAIKDPDWFRGVCRQFADRLVLGIDARDGLVATNGWIETSDANAVSLAQEFSGEPLAGIVYTDIATDGMMAGPNLAAMTEMQAAIDLPVIASGGVTTIDDVRHLRRANMSGCIIGRAIYERTIDLAEAVQIAEAA